MDVATLIGLLLAWGAVIYAMFHASHGHVMSYLKPVEMFLVFGGSIGAALLSMPLHNVTGVMAYIKKWMFNRHGPAPRRLPRRGGFDRAVQVQVHDEPAGLPRRRRGLRRQLGRVADHLHEDAQFLGRSGHAGHEHQVSDQQDHRHARI